MGVATNRRLVTSMAKETITALTKKRADLVLEMERLQTALRGVNIDIDHVDKALRLLGAPLPAQAKVTPRLRKETARIILATLRETGRPMTSVELTERVMIERKISPSEHDLIVKIKARVRATLAHYRRKSILVSKEKAVGLLEWSIA